MACLKRKEDLDPILFYYKLPGIPSSYFQNIFKLIRCYQMHFNF